MLHYIDDADPACQTYLEGEKIPMLHRNELSGRRTLDEGITASELGSGELRCIMDDNHITFFVFLAFAKPLLLLDIYKEYQRSKIMDDVMLRRKQFTINFS